MAHLSELCVGDVDRFAILTCRFPSRMSDVLYVDPMRLENGFESGHLRGITEVLVGIVFLTKQFDIVPRLPVFEIRPPFAINHESVKQIESESADETSPDIDMTKCIGEFYLPNFLRLRKISHVRHEAEGTFPLRKMKNNMFTAPRIPSFGIGRMKMSANSAASRF
jgi:hypothetical protein